MELTKILSMVDHTLLKPESTWAQIQEICDDAIKYGTATVCIPASYVARCRAYMDAKASKVGVCTVIGFPHGSHETAIKVAEAKLALDEGCTELDMVINIGKMIAGDTLYVKNEIKLLADLAHAQGAILKVILETCYLTDEQKLACCQLAEAAGADFVKTSTGYGSKGCTIDDLKLMRASVSEHVRVKGSGGIRDLDTVLSARAVGASRCGVSATAAIMAEAEKRYAEGTLVEVTELTEMSGGY